MPPKSATKSEVEELRSLVGAVQLRLEAAEQEVQQLKSELAACKAAGGLAALTEHLQLLHRCAATVDLTRLILKNWTVEKLPQGEADASVSDRLRLAILAVNPGLEAVVLVEGQDDPSTPVRKSGDLDGTPGFVGSLVVAEFPRALHTRMVAIAPQLQKRFGIVLAPFLTPYGAALRRLRQPVYEQLRKEGRNPRWRDGARILITAAAGRDEFFRFAPLE